MLFGQHDERRGRCCGRESRIDVDGTRIAGVPNRIRHVSILRRCMEGLVIGHPHVPRLPRADL